MLKLDHPTQISRLLSKKSKKTPRLNAASIRIVPKKGGKKEGGKKGKGKGKGKDRCQLGSQHCNWLHSGCLRYSGVYSYHDGCNFRRSPGNPQGVKAISQGKGKPQLGGTRRCSQLGVGNNAPNPKNSKIYECLSRNDFFFPTPSLTKRSKSFKRPWIFQLVGSR